MANAFLRLDGVKGGSMTAGYVGWIELESVSFGDAPLPVSATSGRSNAAQDKRAHTQINCMGRLDANAPTLMQMAADGKTVNGELVMLDRGTRYLSVKLMNAFVSSMQTTGDRGQGPGESFQLVALPFTIDFSLAAQLLGRWNVTIGQWQGVFVFEDGGKVYWTERTGVTRHAGTWKASTTELQWKFATPADVRTFALPLPIAAGLAKGRIMPVGQGFFSMIRA